MTAETTTAISSDFTIPPDLAFRAPITAAVRRALDQVRDSSAIADLLYLERWEMAPQPGAAAALRMVQIRRANPDLAAAVRAEINAFR